MARFASDNPTEPAMRRRLPDLLILLLLFALPLVTFWAQTVGGRTLLPTENLFQYAPYDALRDSVGAPTIPHNHLLSDLVLQNLQWKSFIRDQLASGEFPLWNPHQFSGIAFFAAGQASTLYPLNILYYMLDLPAAYGWFMVVQLWIAGVFMMLFARTIGAGRSGGMVAGVTYQLAAFFLASAVFPMIVASAAWLPLILLAIEGTIRRAPIAGRPARLPWIALGAAALGCNILAGHVEITYYTLIVAGGWSAARLIAAWRTLRLRGLVATGASLLALVGLGGAIGAIQFIPLFEAAAGNFRAAGAPFQQVLDWGHPPRDVVQFLMPNFYGSPAQHDYFDIFALETISLVETPIYNTAGDRITHTEWGMKNYVEAALYVGILPLILAAIALIDSVTRRRRGSPPYRAILAILALASLTFMFGLPTYAILYYTLPGIDQLHSPFRWVFPFTLAIAALAGLGVEALIARTRVKAKSEAEQRQGTEQEGAKVRRVWVDAIALVSIGAGGLILLAIVAVRFGYDRLEAPIARVMASLAKANDAFSDPAMFVSVQATNALVLGVMLIGSGLIVIALSRKWRGATLAAALLIAVDLMIATGEFNPASDPRLLDVTPPSIAWLQAQREGRYITLDEVGKAPLLNANMTMRYRLDDVRGYESIIPADTVRYMESAYPQVQLEYNRIAPLYADRLDGVDWDRLALLNVRYLITHANSAPDVITRTPAYPDPLYADDSVHVYELPSRARAFTVGLDARTDAPQLDSPRPERIITVLADTGREIIYQVGGGKPDSRAWLIISAAFDPGWRAFIREAYVADSQETALPIERVDGMIMGVRLPDDGQRGYLVRLVYSPASFQIGLFASAIGSGITVLLVGAWGWGLIFRRRDDESGAARLARNSLAPILLNLFNRGIDMAFALVMLRILGPTDAGWYFYAGVVFVWFDIFTNFGLNLYLTREVARDRSRARALFINTSVLRIALVAAGVPLLILFFAARQGIAEPPLTPTVIVAIALLYVGLLPNSLSTGFTALFYAFERAETPAAVATVSTLSKVILGLIALLAGAGFVGLATASIVTNVLTLGILAWFGRGLLRGSASGPIELGGMRRMIGESAPLLFNHFLATIFFQIDVIILEALKGAAVVGQYSVAYKWLTALNVIPSFFTQALFARLVTNARDDRDKLRRDVTFALKLLFALALPIAVFFTFTAYFWAGLLGGAEYLPDGAIATQIMILSIPIGWLNSLVQYALIALDMQRRLTGVFAVAVGFNIAANLIFVPEYGYRASALITILSEGVLCRF